METKDRRTHEQRQTHKWAVVARDTFMSGWGSAHNGASRCAWAVPDEFIHDGKIDRLESWARNRKEMKYVNVVNLDTYRPPSGTAHFSIYVADATHPAFGGAQ
jgi:hypothetical protein